jgi:transketolase
VENSSLAQVFSTQKITEILDKPKKGSMRDAYASALIKLGSEIKDIVVVGADTTGSIKTAQFGEKFPDRFFNVGIAESNLVSVAAGLAIAGKIAFASTYAVFAPGKCVDQIRNAIAYPDVDVKIVASHAGISVGPDGASHQELEDIATMRAIPNMSVMVPSDPSSTTRLVEILALTTGPFYMRIARPDCPFIYSQDQVSSVSLGQSVTLRDGNDATIIACGLLVYEALIAARNLARDHSLNVRVIDMLSIKPIDQSAIVRAAAESGAIVTAEEHNVIGGLGGAVAEITSEKHPVLIRRVGTLDTFGESGEPKELMAKYGLTANNISQKVLELKMLSRK